MRRTEQDIRHGSSAEVSLLALPGVQSCATPPKMRLSTAAWFSTGCGLALLSLVAGQAVIDAVRDSAVAETSADASLEASLLAAPEPDHSVPLSEVPIQRPRHLRERPPVAPPPPLPVEGEGAVDEVAHGWNPDDARLPATAVDVARWEPDDARLPQGSAVVAAVRAMWSPDSATLPLSEARWDPDEEKPVRETCSPQRKSAAADWIWAMTMPRNLYPDTTLYVTCRCVHRSYRLVPTSEVRRAFAYAFAVVSSRYRSRWGMAFHEFEVLSTHYHLVLYDRFGKVTDFIQDLNSMVARVLNSVRGTSGRFFDGEPGIQTILGEKRIIEHCVYTLANAVAAGIVHKTAHWKGFNSLRMQYGKMYSVKKPRIGIWSKKRLHQGRRASRRSGRSNFAGRSKLPETAVLQLDRPLVRVELSDVELRVQVREALAAREAKLRTSRGGPVLGMKAAMRIHWSTTPVRGEELFERRPTFSTQTSAQRRQMKRVRRAFLTAYRAALGRWKRRERDVIFPPGTVRMRLRHNALTEPIPLELLLAE